MDLSNFSKEELINLVHVYARNLIALDGGWFQSVEKRNGMEKAMYHDEEAWKVFSIAKARRIKKFLLLPEQPGLEGLKKALSLRYSTLANEKIEFPENTSQELIYKIITCRVQAARKNKGLLYHPCKSVGLIENSFFAKTIDDRIECETLSCYPEITDTNCACAWRFTIKDEKPV
ncbi:MAG: DUF6125 family protein [Candidatus Azobacteroides sp.]|nr:DUF6125 family protein [Candidatus Azobacteroides sp.]